MFGKNQYPLSPLKQKDLMNDFAEEKREGELKLKMQDEMK